MERAFHTSGKQEPTLVHFLDKSTRHVDGVLSLAPLKTEFLPNDIRVCIRIQFVPHRKHITSPLQKSTGECRLRKSSQNADILLRQAVLNILITGL
jgi:hypothetical protein